MYDYSLKRVSQPSIEPVSVADVKLQAHISHSVQDGILSTYITSCREWVEDYVRTSLISGGWEISFDYIPTFPLMLPMIPIISILSIKMYDVDNIEITLNNSDFLLSTNGRLTINNSTTMPIITARDNRACVITYTAGFGTTSASVPAVYKTTILSMASFMDDNRVGELQIPDYVYNILRPYRQRY